MKDIFVAPNAIDRFLNDYSFVNMIKDKKIFLVGTAEHSNIGDAAIVAGEYEFLKKYYPDVYEYHLNDIYSWWRQLRYSVFK